MPRGPSRRKLHALGAGAADGRCAPVRGFVFDSIAFCREGLAARDGDPHRVGQSRTLDDGKGAVRRIRPAARGKLLATV